MATFQEPTITKIFWGGFDLQNLMWALYRHFETSPTSQFTPSLSNEITTDSLGPGTYSFLLTPKAVGETWQLNFRNSGSKASPNATTINLGIDPAATIVNSSTAPPSSDSDFSGEIGALQVTTGASSDGTAFIWEYPDALCVLLPSGTLDPWSFPHGFMAGKLWTAPFANDPTNGRDGLAILGHIPRITTSDVGAYWLTDDAASLSRFHLSTDSWDDTVKAALDADVAALDWLEEGGATSPGPLVLAYNLRPLGVMKHLFYMAPVQTPLKRFADNDGVTRYLTVESDVAGAVIAWDSSTVPLRNVVEESGVATYADLPLTATHGELEEVTSGTAAGIYQYVAVVGGDSFGMWLPSNYANRVTDYVRDASSNPCKISMSNGVGSDTKSILTGRGWVESNTGNAAISDASGDLEFSGGTNNGNSSNMTFTPATGTLSLRQVLWVVALDVLTSTGGWRSAAMTIRGNTSNHYPVLIDCALGGAPNLNKVGFINNTATGQVGQGSVTFSSFEPVFGELSTGWTSPGTSPLNHIWKSSVGQVVGDTSCQVDDFTFNAGHLVTFFALNTGGIQPVVRVREFHLFQMEG